jgi:hypothetical protein
MSIDTRDRKCLEHTHFSRIEIVRTTYEGKRHLLRNVTAAYFERRIELVKFNFIM